MRMPALRASLFDRQSRGRAGEPASLEARQHAPPALVDQVATPGALPITDRPNRLVGLLVDDLEHARVWPQIALMPLDDLLPALGPAEVLRHLSRVQRLQQRRSPGSHGSSRTAALTATTKTIAHRPQLQPTELSL